MKIIIKGAGFANKGAEAMALTVQKELLQRLPNCEFFLWSCPQVDCRRALSNGFSLFKLPFEKKHSLWHWPRGESVNLRLWSLLELCRTGDPKEIWSIIAPGQTHMAKACNHYISRCRVVFDAFIDISGFSYGDASGIRGFRSLQHILNYFQINAKPAVFMPQAWGSFNRPQIQQTLLQILEKHNTSYYSRDEASCRYLEQALGKPHDSIAVSPDIAFGFEGGNTEQGEHVLRRMGCSMKRPIIGIAPNVRVYQRVSGTGMGNKYLQALVMLIIHCHKHHDVDIILQSNEINSSDDQLDDRYLCSLIAASVKNSVNCFMSNEYISAEATRALIGKFDYLISSRYHSLVFGFSQGVPAVAVSWLHKYRELFSLFGQEDCVQEYQNIDANSLINKFERGWGKRKSDSASILLKAMQLKDLVGVLFDEVAENIQNVSPSRND